MSMATLTSKGQVTIPKDIRDVLHLRVGDRIDFSLAGANEVVVRPATKRVAEVFGRLHRPGRKPLTTAEMDAMVRQRHQGASE